VIAILRLALLAAYLPLAWVAEARHAPTLAAVALADLALLLLIEPLLRPRVRAWLLAIALAALLFAPASAAWTLPALWLVPPLFLAIVGGLFLRSLRPGRTPLIAKAIAAIYGLTPDTLPAPHARYARRLTFAWGALLAALAVANAVVALVAVPDGVLAQSGRVPPFSIDGDRGAFHAQLLTWGALLAFAVVEFQLRKRVFPVRPYRNAFDFARRMAALGPGFWREFFR
jgi:uncharacterized membrane protein